MASTRPVRRPAGAGIRVPVNEEEKDEKTTVRRHLLAGVLLSAAILTAQLGLATNQTGESGGQRLEREVRRE